MSIRKSDDINFEVKGADMQYVEVSLQPGQCAIAQPGTLMYMEQGVQMATKISDGSEQHSGFIGSIVGAGKRMMAGEDMFVTFFTNNDTVPHSVAFAGPFLGRIQAIDLSQVGGSILCQRGGFLCSAKGVTISVGISRKIGFGLFGGDGFVMQKVSGDGVAFIHASGAIEEKTLLPGQTLFVEPGSLVGFQSSVEFDIKSIRGLKNLLFSGEDMFLTTVTGPGKVWVQSVPYSRLIAQITAGVLQMVTKK